MSGPFATYFGNQRTVDIPLTPQKCTTATLAGAGITVCDVIALTAANLTNGTVIAYIHFIGLYALQTAAASAIQVNYQWQFRTAAHANVGAAIPLWFFSADWNAAAAAAVGTSQVFSPPRPWWKSLTIPATAAEIVLQRNTTATGAPSATSIEQWGVDPLNTGIPGDIGGGGIVAQGTQNPNAF